MWNSSQNSFCIGRSAIQREFARLQSRGGSRYKVHEEGMGRPLDENWGISQGQMKESGGSEDTSDISVLDFDLFRGYPPKEEEDAGMQGKECQVWKGPGVCTSSKYSCFFQSAPMT